MAILGSPQTTLETIIATISPVGWEWEVGGQPPFHKEWIKLFVFYQCWPDVTWGAANLVALGESMSSHAERACQSMQQNRVAASAVDGGTLSEGHFQKFSL